MSRGRTKRIRDIAAVMGDAANRNQYQHAFDLLEEALIDIATMLDELESEAVKP